MRGLIFAFGAFAFLLSAEAVPAKTLNIAVPEENVEELYKKLYDLQIEKNSNLEEILASDSSAITAVVNNFVDDLFPNIGNYCVNHGFDPVALADQGASVLGSSVKLTAGHLDGISTLTRNGDVSLTYSHDQKLLTLDAPIEFDNLGFTYHYKIQLLFVTLSSGELKGKMNHLRIKIQLTFDFHTYVAKMNKFNLMNSGHIDIIVDSGLVEQVVTILSELVTTVLHPFLVTFVQVIVKGVVNNVVNSVNHAINETFVSPHDVHNILN